MTKASLRFADLKHFRDQLALDAERRAQAEREAAAAVARRQAEANLLRDAFADVTPLKPANRAAAAAGKPKPPPLPLQTERDEQAALAESLSDDIDADTLLETDENLSWRREGIGPDVVRRLRRGHWVLEAQIDLHGARRDQARVQLAEFLRDCMRRGIRCVRVIHGKGHGSAGRQPVLKGKVRGWLMQKSEVLAFCQAQAQDGGSGALMVLLRPGNG